MATMNLASFLKRVSEDENLRREFMDLALRHGIAISPDELSEAELQKVAGGAGYIKLDFKY